MENTIDLTIRKEACLISEYEFNYKKEETIEKLKEKGFGDQQCSDILAEVKKMFEAEKMEEQRVSEYERVAITLLIAIGLFCTIFNTYLIPVQIILILVGAMVGAIGFVKARFAGFISAGLFIFFSKYAYLFYFWDRTTALKLEFFMPLFLAAIPAIFVFQIIKFIRFLINANNDS